jgi:cytoskeletal protein CcmA (bactofilin family)
VKKLFVCVLAAFLLVSIVSVSHARVLVKDTSVVKLNEDINMGQGLMFKDLVAFKGNVNVKGDVGGDVVAVLGNVHLFPTARVSGDIVSIGGKITRDEGSKVKGEITEIVIGKGGEKMAEAYAPLVVGMGVGGLLLLKALAFLGFIGLSMIIVSFMTGKIGAMSSKIEKEWLKTLLWGILGFVLIGPIAVLLAITVIGIPLIVVEMILVSIAMLTGYIAVSQLIGKKFTKAIRRPNQPMIIEVMWGLAILFLVDMIPVLGMMVKCLAMTFGFGSAIMTKLGKKA